MMKKSHSRGAAKEQCSDQTAYSGKHPALILRLRESGTNLADSMVFFSMSALARMQR